MKRHFLFKLLVLPLTTAAAALVLASFWLAQPWRGLSTNIAAGLLGSIVTVFYVEKIIRKGEESKWAKVRSQVGNEVSILANTVVTSVRLALGLRLPSLIPNFDPTKSDPHSTRMLMLSLIENHLLPRGPDLSEISQKDWQQFSNNLRDVIRNAERVLSLFSSNLDPTIMGFTLDIHETARGVLTEYLLLADMLGIPFGQLKPNNRGKSMAPYMQEAYRLLSRDVEKLLRTCASLLREIDRRFPDTRPSS